MALRDRLDRLLGLGPSDEPRRFSVGRRGRARILEVVSTPGARVCITRDGRDGDLARVLLYCVRKGIPVELRDGENALSLDGRTVTPAELRRAL